MNEHLGDGHTGGRTMLEAGDAVRVVLRDGDTTLDVPARVKYAGRGEARAELAVFPDRAALAAVVQAALTLAANEGAHWAVYGDDAASQAEHILNVGVAVRSLLGQPEPEWKSMMPPPSGSTSADRAWVIG